MAVQAPILVAGEWKTTRQNVEIRSPFDQALIGTTWQADAHDLEKAIAGAVQAAESVTRLGGQERQRILSTVSKRIEREREEFAVLIAREAAKPIRTARAEVDRAVFTFALAAEAAGRLHDKSLEVPLPGGAASRQGTLRCLPAGAVAAITPFNFPLNLVAHKLAPAMAIGCPVVLKPAPQTPLTALRLARLVLEAGWPAGALSVVPLTNEHAARMVADERMRVLSFTGSAQVGWELKAKAGKKRVLLELGGNAAVIVHGDAEVAAAAERCAFGGFTYSGQSCISVQRILVQQEIYRRFLDELVPRVQALRSGDPLEESTDCGPLIRESDAARVEAWIREAQADGAHLLCGGQRRGSFVDPAVLTNTRPEHKVNAEEIFGPVVTVESYGNFAEAIDAVNRSRYGLQAGVFTGDGGIKEEAFAKLAVGGLIVNDVPTFRSDAMPYGGVKDSGLGREGVRYAMAEMSEMRIMVE